MTLDMNISLLTVVFVYESGWLMRQLCTAARSFSSSHPTIIFNYYRAVEPSPPPVYIEIIHSYTTKSSDTGFYNNKHENYKNMYEI